MKKISIFIFAFVLFFSSCFKVPITERRQVRVLPESIMTNMGLTAYNDFLKTNTPYSVNSNNEAKRIKTVGEKMSNSVDSYLISNGYKKIKNQFQWDYRLVNDPSVNAWCMPGGKIVFYTGIMPLIKSDDDIAVIMGHEMAHAVARHGNERLSQQLALYMGGISLAVALKEKPEETRNLFLAVYGAGGALGSLAYSRKHEYEADKIGMVFMALAGYDPKEAITFWERMKSHTKGGAQIPQFLSTHPHHENRIEEMKKYLPTALKYKS